MITAPDGGAVPIIVGAGSTITKGLLSMRTRSKRRGFSLLELVAVVTLIGIVAAVTMYRLNSVDKKTASENVMKQNVNLLQTAVERYRFDKNAFPSNLTDLVTAGFLPKYPTDTEFFKYSYDSATG